LSPNKWWHKEEGKAYRVIHGWGSKEYVWEGIYTKGASTRTETATKKPNWPSTPPTSTPWQFWHAYYVGREELVEEGPSTSRKVDDRLDYDNDIEELSFTEPQPDPTYHYKRQYFSNQLVATYKDKHKTVAELNEDGTLSWKTTPEVYLLRDGEVYGKVLRIHFIPPDVYRLYLADIFDPHSLRFVHLRTDQDKDIQDIGWKPARAVTIFCF
jgi:hypothetical protein